MFPTRFLKAAQLLAWMVTEIIVTIARIVEEEVSPKPNQTSWKPVLYFLTKDNGEYGKGYLISAKVDAESLVTATGEQLIKDVAGKKIRIKLAEFRGKSVLRIDPDPVKDPKPEPKPEPEHDGFEEGMREYYNRNNPHRTDPDPEPEEPEDPDGFITESGEAAGEERG
jgi:hypothetical protein